MAAPLRNIRVVELVQVATSLAFSVAMTHAGADAAIRNDAKMGRPGSRPAFFVHH
jgi:hypothetical protein